MILVTQSLVTVENTGGGESGAMCCDFREVGKVEHIFSNFSVKNSTNHLGSFQLFDVQSFTLDL